ncbi:hypothetical protein K2173_028484 [Erythroxylum novogranatense]|uniref:Oberon PHD finger domain-containing protein n=1 Tax=Erythroxylum novogranatense TaxID=1862640 RepID=A0AAV8U1Z1_9ROSI|nr:hypothetical protein K2173_028484 [Erythroxylum novogranatense]
MNAGGFPDFVLDPARCSRLSLGEKMQLVQEIAHGSKHGPEVLSSFTRRELLEMICAETGKERKYSGYSKIQMIGHLLMLVSQKSKRIHTVSVTALCPTRPKTGMKRRRQKETHLQLSTDLNPISPENENEGNDKRLCQNVACRATVSPNDDFCKRCTCCICHYYDDNKDPSLWLTCSSDAPGEYSCGLTCHLICALKDERTGIMKIGSCSKLDGSFYCISCGKINDLMRSWRKQLVVAKEARRVDALCLRVLLGHRILTGTEQYKEMQERLDTALQMLKDELGPLDLVCAKMARGIVNRLSCGAEVQNLCVGALEAFDSMSSDNHPDFGKKKKPASCRIRFEESTPTSVIVTLECVYDLFEDLIGCTIWHRKSGKKDYPAQPTLVLLKPEKRFQITDLIPSTEYFCKILFFSKRATLAVCEAKWITPSSSVSLATESDDMSKGNGVVAEVHSRVKSAKHSNIKLPVQEHSTQLKSVKRISKNKNEGVCLHRPLVEAVSLISCGSLSPPTPCKSNGMPEVAGVTCKRQLEESSYEYSVRVVKWLEHEGHIGEDFRVKFLTWFSLKATMQERRAVNVFVDILIDDPPSLAEQLIDTFNEVICCEQKPVPQHGFCIRLWH